MIFFDRSLTGAGPKSLINQKPMRSINNAIVKHMDLPHDKREQTDIPPVWKTPFHDDVMADLGAISWGHCAFCGLNQELSVYRFRPPAYAQPRKPVEGDESYLWLSFAWENLFPICPSCRPTNQNAFPVRGDRAGYGSGPIEDEKADLIYPGELAQPHRSFTVRSDGQLIGLTRRARLTIEHFHLNASEKVEAHRASLEDFADGIQTADWDWEGRSHGTRDGILYLYHRRIAARMLARSGRRLSLSPDGIFDTMMRLSQESDYQDQIIAAVAEVLGEDQALESSVDQPQDDTPKTAGSQAASQPTLARVDLKTYKSLESIAFDIAPKLSDATTARLHANAATSTSLPEAPCVLILGENATGKSSILEAIALTLISTEERDRLKMNAAHLTLNPEYMGAPDASPVARSDVALTFHPDPTSSPPGPRLVTLRIDGSATEPFTEGGDRNMPLTPVFAYGAHRLYGKDKRRSSLRHVETLFHNDRQLPKPETWLSKLSSHNLDQVARALRHIIQIDGDFHTIEIDKATKQCQINIEKTPPEGAPYIVPQRMDIASSGYRTVFALVCDVLEGLTKHTGGDVAAARNTPAIVLIDEIEAHLHPRWKLHVITGLRRALPKVTFIITSHDPLCVRGMYDGEVLALNRYQNTQNHGLGMPERVEPVEGFENVETLTIEQLLTSELFQLLSTDNPELDRSLARAADALSQAAVGSAPAVKVMEEMDEILSTALPYGQNEIARIVQEAVAEFLTERRDRDHDANAKARKKAKDAIKRRLREVMS
jgi:hypothetical protein